MTYPGSVSRRCPKIDKAVKPENIMLIDNSALHSKHKFYDPKKFHIKLIIKSLELQKMDKIQATKKNLCYFKKRD